MYAGGDATTAVSIKYADSSSTNYDCLTSSGSNDAKTALLFNQNVSVSCNSPAASNTTGNCSSAYLQSLLMFQLLFSKTPNQSKTSSTTVDANFKETLADIITLSTDNTTCTMPKNIIAYIFYYEAKVNSTYSQYYYAIDSIGWTYKRDDMTITIGSNATFTLNLVFINVGFDKYFTSKPGSPSMFPKSMGGFTRPLIDRNW